MISLVDLPKLTSVSIDSLHVAMSGGFDLYAIGNVTLSGLASLAALSLPNLAVAKVVQRCQWPSWAEEHFLSNH